MDNDGFLYDPRGSLGTTCESNGVMYMDHKPRAYLAARDMPIRLGSTSPTRWMRTRDAYLAIMYSDKPTARLPINQILDHRLHLGPPISGTAGILRVTACEHAQTCAETSTYKLPTGYRSLSSSRW